MQKFYTATDVTANRCTITGVYDSLSAANGAAEQDDLTSVFASEQALDIGSRAVQDGVFCWAVPPFGRIDGSETSAD